MIESLRTTQIAFFRFSTPSGFLGVEGLGGQRRGTKIISRYQTLVSSLPREAVFLHRQPKTEFITGPHRQRSLVTTRQIPLGPSLGKQNIQIKDVYSSKIEILS